MENIFWILLLIIAVTVAGWLFSGLVGAFGLVIAIVIFLFLVK